METSIMFEEINANPDSFSAFGLSFGWNNLLYPTNVCDP